MSERNFVADRRFLEPHTFMARAAMEQIRRDEISLLAVAAYVSTLYKQTRTNQKEIKKQN